MSPGGNRVFVTGHVQSQAVTAEYGTVAYNATTGARLWARRYAGPGATSLAVSPDRTKVYVTGESHFNYGTLAYSARTGTRLWARFYGGRRSNDVAYSVAVSPGGTRARHRVQPRAAAGSNPITPRSPTAPAAPSCGPGATTAPATRQLTTSACGGRSRQRQGVRHRDQLGRQRHRGRLRHRRLQRPHRRPAVGQAVQRPGQRHRPRHGRWPRAAAGYSSPAAAQGPLQATTTPPSPTTADRTPEQPRQASGPRQKQPGRGLIHPA